MNIGEEANPCFISTRSAAFSDCPHTTISASTLLNIFTMSSYFDFAEQKMPEGLSDNPPMNLVKSAEKRGPTIRGSDLGVFVGQAYLDPVFQKDQTSIINVCFTPGARTNWHYHELGQFIRVTAGTGWVCDKGGKPNKINVGDVVWCPPGTVHWHGADDGSMMVHQVVTHGKVEWYEPVSEEEYGKKNV